jgi:YidC/Oxa1 family membrane protein insertase
MCAWTWIVNLMLGLLSIVHSVWPHNYGLAIIVMVLVVRFLLHPLTKKGQVNMARMAEQMQALQPKMEEIRRKHEGDRQRINQETMKLYQTEGVNPAGQMFGCLPMFCQLPIWAALWAALQTTVELRHEPFIFWIHDLTTPDHLIEFGRSFPLIGNAFNLLPPLLGISMWLQNKYMPKPASASQSSTQATQQKMMMSMMSVMMVVFFYNAPSGLTLYIMSSNFFGLFEQWRIRKHIAEEKARHAAEGTKPRFQKPKWIQKLERLAEEAREQQQQQQKKKKT